MHIDSSSYSWFIICTLGLTAFASDAIAQGTTRPAFEAHSAFEWNPADQSVLAPTASAVGGPVSAPPGPKTPADVPSTVVPRASRGVPDDYQIGEGDALQVSVWKEPDASVQSVVVRPDGKISMPLLKQVLVVGLTPTEAERLITEKLSRLINSPDVTVVVTEINSKKIYVVGAVKKEGPIPFTYRMSVM